MFLWFQVKQSDVGTEQGSYNNPFTNHETEYRTEKISIVDRV